MTIEIKIKKGAGSWFAKFIKSVLETVLEEEIYTEQIVIVLCKRILTARASIGVFNETVVYRQSERMHNALPRLVFVFKIV